MAFLREVARQFVVGRERAIGGILRRHERDDVFEISLRASFPDEQMQPEPQLLPRFLQLGALVVGAHSGERVGIQVFPRKPGACPSTAFPFPVRILASSLSMPRKTPG